LVPINKLESLNSTDKQPYNNIINNMRCNTDNNSKNSDNLNNFSAIIEKRENNYLGNFVDSFLSKTNTSFNSQSRSISKYPAEKLEDLKEANTFKQLDKYEIINDFEKCKGNVFKLKEICKQKRNRNNEINQNCKANEIKNIIKNTLMNVDKINIDGNLIEKNRSLSAMINQPTYNFQNKAKIVEQKSKENKVINNFKCNINNNLIPVSAPNLIKKEKFRIMESIVINQKSSSSSTKYKVNDNKFLASNEGISNFSVEKEKDQFENLEKKNKMDICSEWYIDKKYVNKNSEQETFINNDNFIIKESDCINRDSAYETHSTRNQKILVQNKDEKTNNMLQLDPIKEESISAENKNYTTLKNKVKLNDIKNEHTSNFFLNNKNDLKHSKIQISYPKIIPYTENKYKTIDESFISIVEKDSINSNPINPNDSIFIEENSILKIGVINSPFSCIPIDQQKIHIQNENENNKNINEFNEFCELMVKEPIENETLGLEVYNVNYDNLQINSNDYFSKINESYNLGSKLFNKIEKLANLEISAVENDQVCLNNIISNKEKLLIENINFEIKNYIQILDEQNIDNSNNKLESFIKNKYPKFYQNYLNYQIQNQNLMKTIEEKANTIENLNQIIIEKKIILENYNKSYKDMLSEIEQQEKIRRRMHNFIQEIRGNIRVYVRVKPTINVRIKVYL